ncbi:uncharacterized protein [Parasteatoda tepidariorum]|uniref:uncharacterized protein n=1 Tax=Parasteatoda tepidariorum TaxID=114398 RepID=UPI0039BCFCB7
MRTLIFSTLLCALVILLQDSIHPVQSQPVQYSKVDEYEKSTGEKLTYDEDNECRHGGQIRDLCERCAKVTKNELVFPMCCSEQKGVRRWCKEFLDYRPVEPILSS